MCPFYNPSKKECKVVPYDSSARRDDSEIERNCKDSYNHKKCGNFEAYERGDYKIER